jgi:hypothetical protein
VKITTAAQDSSMRDGAEAELARVLILGSSCPAMSSVLRNVRVSPADVVPQGPIRHSGPAALERRIPELVALLLVEIVLIRVGPHFLVDCVAVREDMLVIGERVGALVNESDLPPS